ncbi:MAG: DUF1990 domain-containing protein [Terracidiphilus sp.]
MSRPTTTRIAQQAVLAERSRPKEAQLLGVKEGLKSSRVPILFAHDRATCSLGRGAMAFENAQRAFEHWIMFDLGWVRVENSSARIRAGQIVAVQVHALGLWSLNHCHILEVTATPNRFGFVYGTTQIHVESGEERFLIELNPATDEVTYTLEAVSHPRTLLTWLGYPVTRRVQRRFVEDSQRRMQDAV